MITFRKVELETDYPILVSWWEGHKTGLMPKEVLNTPGFVAMDGEDMIAMSFIYIAVGGSIAVIEWTTTNPKFSFSKKIVDAVKGLFLHMEEAAKAEGTLCVISFVKPNGSEQRIMSRLGYFGGDPSDPGHVMYCKSLKGVAEPCLL